MIILFVYLIKEAKNLQLYIGNQLFQTGIKSDLEAYLELKKRSEFFDEFIIDYNRFLNNYTVYAFPINRYSKKINQQNILI